MCQFSAIFSIFILMFQTQKALCKRSKKKKEGTHLHKDIYLAF
jgi:hypothetical protein